MTKIGKPSGNVARPRPKAHYKRGEITVTSEPGPQIWALRSVAIGGVVATILWARHRRGTCYNSLRGPGYYDWDLSFRKILSLWREGWNLRFQADLFNAFNHPNFHNPNGSLTASAYTTIDASGPPREIQLGLKFSF